MSFSPQRSAARHLVPDGRADAPDDAKTWCCSARRGARILDGYTSAGKTGTAQKVDPNTHAYSTTDYVGSFVGFAPVNNPAMSIAVILDSARGLHQGGQVSAPVFKRVAEQVLAYLNVPHDAEIKHDPAASAARPAGGCE